MQYIEDMWPRRILDVEKYRKYTALRKEREDFLARSTCICYAEWNIHKKLYQERFSKRYLYLARGNGKWRAIDDYLDALEAGRDVTVMNARDAFTKPTQLGCYKYLNDPFSDLLYKEFQRQLITDWTKDYIYQFEFKPIVRPDAYTISNHYIYNNYLWSNLALNVVKESMYELINDTKGENDETLG